ncbi:MAG: response regulator, partial [Candidatus Omnitrophota bacterium]
MLRNDRKQILIVHNDLNYVGVLSQALYEKGFDALTAASCQGVVQKAGSLDIDLILLGDDIQGGTGFEVCQLLKGSRRTEHIPVILLVTDSKVERRVRGYHHGADDCMGMDFD